MISDLERRLNPRLVGMLPEARMAAFRIERATRRECALLEPFRMENDGPIAGPESRLCRIPGGLGRLFGEILRRTRRRRFRIAWPGGGLALSGRTRVMGVLNVTPDSFSDGGLWLDPDRAAERGLEMIRQGADLVDVGGESTRPGARAVPEAEERRRVVPVVERLARKGVIVSIDTSKAGVAEAAFRAGARILNDVTALRGDPAMARVAVRAQVPVILMHMRGTPRTMQRDPRYGDVAADLCRFFRKILKIALSAGIRRDRILLDPGIGFGKTPEHNLEILRRLDELRSVGFPLVVGTSRKSFIGRYLGRPVDERLYGTAATVATAVFRGADIVRVHDVREMADVARMTSLLR